MPISLSSGVAEWQPDAQVRNFGDHLALFIGQKLFTDDGWGQILHAPDKRYVLLGSFICNHNLTLVLDAGYQPMLVGCGYRGEALNPELLRRTVFYGCRGFHTQRALSNHGISAEVLGDPGTLVSLLHPRAAQTAKSIFVPHINDPQRHDYSAARIGCDQIFMPDVRNLEDVEALVHAISGAKFVLAGAMHAAVVAYAYGIPFAFFRNTTPWLPKLRPDRSFLDCPEKWVDFLSSIVDDGTLPTFVRDVKEGQRWYRGISSHLRAPRLEPLLEAYAKIAPLRSEFLRPA